MNKRVEQALRTLRAIRQRYDAGSDKMEGRKRSYTVQVALGYADMIWITAAIEALEKATITSPDEVVSADSSASLAASA